MSNLKEVSTEELVQYEEIRNGDKVEIVRC